MHSLLIHKSLISGHGIESKLNAETPRMRSKHLKVIEKMAGRLKVRARVIDVLHANRQLSTNKLLNEKTQSQTTT